MKKKVLFLLSITLFQSCANYKKEMQSNGSFDVAVNNAIIDFSNTSRLFKKNKFFTIRIKDFKDDKIGISISETSEKIYYFTNSDKNKLPNKCLEYKDKLFYWIDENYPQNEKVVEKLHQYKLIDTVESIGQISIKIGDRGKTSQYYFCKNNFLNYKKVKTSIGMGYYTPPKLDCKDNVGNVPN